jgi:hypothetical protein
MSGTESERNQHQYSKSLFSDSDSAETLARVKEAVVQERKRRTAIFRKYILPFFILLLLVVGYVLRKPVMYIFRGPQPFAMPPEQESMPDAEKTDEKAQQKFGNPDAAMKIHLRFMDEAYAPEGIIELAHSAVESKPSEIFFTLEFRNAAPDEESYQVLINDQSEISIADKEAPRKIDFRQSLKEEDFILALESVHEQIYGKGNKPLKLRLSKEILERRRQQQEAAPAVILPEKGAAEIESAGKTIILPDFKADTTVISP